MSHEPKYPKVKQPKFKASHFLGSDYEDFRLTGVGSKDVKAEFNYRREKQKLVKHTMQQTEVLTEDAIRERIREARQALAAGRPAKNVAMEEIALKALAEAKKARPDSTRGRTDESAGGHERASHASKRDNHKVFGASRVGHSIAGAKPPARQ